MTNQLVRNQKCFINKPEKVLFLLVSFLSLFCFKSVFSGPVFYDKYLEEEDQTERWLRSCLFENSEKMSISLNIAKKKQLVEKFASYYLPQKNLQGESLPADNLEEQIRKIVSHYPIEEMIPYISKYERQVAALIIGIAKKESNWGKRSPRLNNRNCYNYWGYKGRGDAGSVMGYACFASAEEAVNTVGRRIEYFVNKKYNSPSRMVVWKCGYSCSWDNPRNVAKWISDVSVYYNQVAFAK